MEQYVKKVKKLVQEIRKSLIGYVAFLVVSLAGIITLGYFLFTGTELSRTILIGLFAVSVIPIGILIVRVGITLSQLREPAPPKREIDLVQLLIGEKHNQDVLGETYEIIYKFSRNLLDEKKYSSYFVQTQEELLRRILRNYELNPIGNPGEGPIVFDPKRHKANKLIRTNEKVFIISIGWEREGKVILPAMVDTDIDQKNQNKNKRD